MEHREGHTRLWVVRMLRQLPPTPYPTQYRTARSSIRNPAVPRPYALLRLYRTALAAYALDQYLAPCRAGVGG
eukprot:3247693-Rhodomonas_salina.1